MSLQSPSLLAQLPQPLGSAGGNVQFGEVHGLQGPKKRKRHEITVAIDGEGVNIYNAQFPKLITSYAIPPQASHSCPPCSVQQKLAGKSVKRQTYCALDAPEKVVKCFLDEHATNSATPNISTHSFPISDTNSQPVFIGTVTTETPSEQNADAFDVIVVHKNGQLRRLSPDLKTPRWNTHPDDIKRGREIATCFTLDFESARKSLFRKRQDIIASVLGESVGSDTSNSTILTLISYPTQSGSFLLSDVRVHFYSIPACVQADGVSGRRTQPLNHLLTLTLPDHQDLGYLSPQEAQWAANLVTGELSLSFNTGFINFDISQYSPQLSSHIIVKDESFSSILRLSPQRIIAAGKSTLSVYDTQYQSLQAAIPLSEVSKVSSKKQRGKKVFEFISRFSKLDILVAVYGSNLFSFDLSAIEISRRISRKQPKKSLLLDSIGKGIKLEDSETHQKPVEQDALKHMQPIGLTQEEHAARWDALRFELDKIAATNDRGQFDALMKNKFNRLSNTGEKATKGFPAANEFIEPEKIYFLLSKIFSFKSVGNEFSSELKISFIPSETFQWLVDSNHLNVTNIQSALRQKTTSRGLPDIADGGLVRALVSSSRSIELLILVLRGPGYLDAVELSHALKALLELARSHTSNSSKSLTAAAHDDTMDDKLSHTQQPAADEPSAILIDAMAGLNLVLIKLHSQPLNRVSQSIRSTLPNSDVLSIIHHLRLSLAIGGHTSRFTEEPPAVFSDPRIPSLPLPTIVDLLTACIDAIGPSGWISASEFAGAAGGNASLITEMKSEVSAALAAIDEATYLKGIVREFLRCCETATSANSSSGNNKTNKSNNSGSALTSSYPSKRLKRRERHKGAEILIYDTPDDGIGADHHHANARMLPLSLKMGEGTPGSIQKPTGEIKMRSDREMGYLKRKAVGKYSFERIVI